MKRTDPTHAVGSLLPRKEVRRLDLHPGDLVLVTTQNSRYTIRMLSQAAYLVSGGWFDRTGQSPTKTTIAGCTWDGVHLHGDLFAARGMRLTFDNSLTTSPIRNVYLLRDETLN